MSEQSTKSINRKLSVAPMMDWTDRHERYFLRLISKQTLLYTEMITASSIIYGDRDYLLDYHCAEHPLALQLGGSNPKDLALASTIARDFQYDEINLNAGCPSDRVQSGRFGACLMAEPELVRDCLMAMMDASGLPVTIKHRIGIDNRDSWDELVHFVRTVAQSGCKTFIVHARIAILSGLSPKENRSIPPLKYNVVYQLKQEFPELEVIINGGVENLEASLQHMEKIDGAMIGRSAYHNPWLLAEADRKIFEQETKIKTRKQILQEYLPYVETQLTKGVYLSSLTRHILGLFQGLPGARRWRRHISENSHKAGAGIEVIQNAASMVECH